MVAGRGAQCEDSHTHEAAGATAEGSSGRSPPQKKRRLPLPRLASQSVPVWVSYGAGEVGSFAGVDGDNGDLSHRPYESSVALCHGYQASFDVHKPADKARLLSRRMGERLRIFGRRATRPPSVHLGRRDNPESSARLTNQPDPPSRPTGSTHQPPQEEHIPCLPSGTSAIGTLYGSRMVPIREYVEVADLSMGQATLHLPEQQGSAGYSSGSLSSAAGGSQPVRSVTVGAGMEIKGCIGWADPHARPTGVRHQTPLQFITDAAGDPVAHSGSIRVSLLDAPVQAHWSLGLPHPFW